MKRTIALAFGALSVSMLVSAQERGQITGVVVDEVGRPLAKAMVHITEQKGFVGHRPVQAYETDEQGHFAINRVPWGSYLVLAGKEDAGYPDTKLAFYSNLEVPTVTLSPMFPKADVRVQLGPKAGVLELSPVTDAVTGKKIESPSITLRRSQNPDLFITTSAAGARILVPSETDILLEVSAPGYKPSASSDGIANTRIRLKPEEVRKLAVSLQPDATK